MHVVCLCVCSHECHCLQAKRGHQNPYSLVTRSWSCLKWVLRTQPGSSAKHWICNYCLDNLLLLVYNIMQSYLYIIYIVTPLQISCLHLLKLELWVIHYNHLAFIWVLSILSHPKPSSCLGSKHLTSESTLQPLLVGTFCRSDPIAAV